MLQPELDQEDLLRRITNRIRQSLELQEILNATVAEVRSLLRTDRVMVYRFNESGGGQVIAESVDTNRLPCLNGLNFPADDIPEQARKLYLTQRLRSIVDLSAGLIGLSPLEPTETDDHSTPQPIHYRPVDACHVKYLQAMGIQSSMVLPIVHYDIQAQQAQKRLWGLLVSHHVKPRSISQRELQIVQSVVDQVSIAIAQSNLLSQTRQQHRIEATINRVSTLLHSLPTIQLQAALKETVNALGSSGGRLYIAPDRVNPRAECLICGTQPAFGDGDSQTTLEEHPVFVQWVTGDKTVDTHNGLSESNSAHVGCQPLIVNDLYQVSDLASLAPAFQGTSIRGWLVVPLYYRSSFLGSLSIFRSQVAQEILWAGKFNPNEKQHCPRQSFEQWREVKRHQAQPWTNYDIELALALGHHFAMAIEQYKLYAQVQALNSNLECQVAERTAKLQQSLEQGRALQRVTNQIRGTLDLKTTLQTIVREVRQLLDTDRVMIYRFTDDSHGQVIVESITGEWLSLLNIDDPQQYFSKAQIQFYQLGKLGVIQDVTQARLTPDQREFLQRCQVQAALIVPIGVGNPQANEIPIMPDSFPCPRWEQPLWGLLIAQECKARRDWLPSEIKLLRKLADQAAVAIQQAELFTHTQAQAQQLASAFHHLKQTQAQLIQTEKMSSLGQLIAGVAHEINNPVNFIYGNLVYTSQYAQDLLTIIHSYQKYHPHPEREIIELLDLIDLEFLEEDLPKLLESMKLGSERIRKLVLSLRNFSRLDQAEKKLVDIHEGVDSTLLILQYRLKGKHNYPEIQVIKNYGKLPLVECYPSQLNQVFMNVLSNAIDALEECEPDKQTITISTSVQSPNVEKNDNLNNSTVKLEDDHCSSPNHVVIQIADSGAGISPELQSQIFDPFFTTKPIGKGTGLGLSISYQIIVEKHGGIFKYSSQPGEGTEFWIEIPICQPQTLEE
ncbi:GAF domain-containing protein [Coleofasciculus sp.]|uniref:GAF domain-containing protein n=1 Tax=Coleofasciculus sp. TaxID=3100458 RepID=UPI0039FA8997